MQKCLVNVFCQQQSVFQIGKQLTLIDEYDLLQRRILYFPHSSIL